MTDTSKTFNVVVTRVFDAPVEKVWKAWSDSGLSTRLSGRTSTPVTSASRSRPPRRVTKSPPTSAETISSPSTARVGTPRASHARAGPQRGEDCRSKSGVVDAAGRQPEAGRDDSGRVGLCADAGWLADEQSEALHRTCRSDDRFREQPDVEGSVAGVGKEQVVAQLRSEGGGDVAKAGHVGAVHRGSLPHQRQRTGRCREDVSPPWFHSKMVREGRGDGAARSPKDVAVHGHADRPAAVEEVARGAGL